jgi:hypothetical protein
LQLEADDVAWQALDLIRVSGPYMALMLTYMQMVIGILISHIEDALCRVYGPLAFWRL